MRYWGTGGGGSDTTGCLARGTLPSRVLLLGWTLLVVGSTLLTTTNTLEATAGKEAGDLVVGQ